MSTGWHISLNDRGRQRVFLIGADTSEKAIEIAKGRCENPSGIVALPMKESECEKLGMRNGTVIESA